MASRILDAATAVLARDGYAGATLGRIAAEAGVDKKMVSYYFSDRDSLLVELIGRVGQQLAANMSAAADALSEPRALADFGVDALWAGSTAEPELLRAYLALVTNNRESPGVSEALTAMKREFEQLFADRLDLLAAAGYRLSVDRDGFIKLMVAILRGLLIDWAEEGDTTALRSGLEQYKLAAAAPFEPLSANELSPKFIDR